MRKNSPKFKAQTKARWQKWRQSDKGREFFSDPKQRFSKCFNFFGGKNKRHGNEFNIPFEVWSDLLKKGCYYCGCDITISYGVGLDRIDHTKGYTVDNVVPACGTCNKMRNVFVTVDEFKVMMTALLNYRKSQLGAV